MQEAVGVSVEVFEVFSQDSVLQRFVEQIIFENVVVEASWNALRTYHWS